MLTRVSHVFADSSFSPIMIMLFISFFYFSVRHSRKWPNKSPFKILLHKYISLTSASKYLNESDILMI